MKINAYRKDPHVEGYDGKKGSPEKKTAIELAYEKGNDSNTVTSFGNETLKTKNLRNINEEDILARDGLDNTGTQGKDSLQDDAYPHREAIKTKKRATNNTGSSSEDFK